MWIAWRRGDIVGLYSGYSIKLANVPLEDMSGQINCGIMQDAIMAILPTDGEERVEFRSVGDFFSINKVGERSQTGWYTTNKPHEDPDNFTFRVDGVELVKCHKQHDNSWKVTSAAGESRAESYKDLHIVASKLINFNVPKVLSCWVSISTD